MNQERLKEQVIDSERVAFFTESDVFQRAVGEVEADILKAFKDTHGTRETREEAYGLQTTLGMLCAKLQGRINDGKVAQSLLEKIAAKLKQSPFLRKVV